ncbi:helix-turn-helix domain-containing protein [Dysgonomonas sp. ZJ709]|uniref:helix-turn-helix domain-containing protein n=1 Tax=Dysgonomonas sp. ZJ709 TaxID=2709797 RepID=UPI0013EC513A|nr:helix-turn-helix domain-containing protein [Dysgonomonas sp. ZJ709]
MEVITIDSEAYKELVKRINTIADFVKNNSCDSLPSDDTWVDSYEVCTFLRISERTLQRLRTNGTITYSVISGKTYYTIAEIKRLLQEKVIRSTEDRLQDLMREHQVYKEQRTRNKPKDKKI